MTTPDHPTGEPVERGTDGVVRVFSGPPPETPQTVAPIPGDFSDEQARPNPTPASVPPPPAPFSPTAVGPPTTGFDQPSTGDEAKAAAGDVKDTAQQQASQVKDTAAQQASEVKDTAQQQAGQVKDTAASAAQDVAATTREQVQNVVGEASAQARQVADSLTSQLTEQANTQQQRAASGVRSLAEGVSDMAEGRGAPSGPVGDLTRQAADQLQTAASYLESKQPAELLDDVRSFASRRPGAFLLGAAVAGFAVGRLVKGASGSSGSSSGSAGSAGSGGSATSSGPYAAGSMQTGNGFGNPTASAPTMTPPPGYESRIPAAPVLPVEPLLDDPYPSAGGERELTDDIARDVYPGSSGGVSGV